MNCEDYLLMLDDYVENELDKKNAIQVSAHIDNCAVCASQYEIMQREQQIYSQYLLDVEATPALWANVQADIEKVQRERFSLSNSVDWLGKTFGASAFNPAFAATSFVLLVMLGVIVGITKYISTENVSKENASNKETISQKADVQTLPEKTSGNTKNEVPTNDKKDYVSKSEDKTTIVQVTNRIKKNVSRSDLSKPTNQFVNSKPVNLNRKLTTDEIVEKAERQYKGAIAILSDDIKRRAQMSPNFISQFEQPLADVDRTINETRRAVRAQPNDAVAVQYMTTAYAKKIELLRAIVGN